MVEDHVVDQPPWKERRDVFFKNRLQNILDIVRRVDFRTGFDETHGGLPTTADTSHEHHALRVRFLPKLGPTFFRPFAAKLVINLPDSVCVGQINPGLIDGQDILPFGAVDVAQEPGTSLQPLKNLGIRQGMDTALFPQLRQQNLGQ